MKKVGLERRKGRYKEKVRQKGIDGWSKKERIKK